MVFNPPYFGGHKYIIMVIDYFMKQAKAMWTFKNTLATIYHFFFNNAITQFGVLKQLISNHGLDFEYET
jgi:hypothetical protein